MSAQLTATGYAAKAAVAAAAASNTTGQLPEWAAVAIRLCEEAVARLDEVISRIDRQLR
ncbi:hypothetical protein [Micromonospora zamorensis]|uniref:hypothetical protein n=1 Tax=Micromonospora zamorensis TaxID=709883 RepID=UPI0033B55219